MKTTNGSDLHEQLKTIFRGYRHMTKAMSHKLKHLGFNIKDGKTHYKIYYKASESHAVVISKSASDWRGGLNISKQLYSMACQVV